jgi:3-dehydroquinate dehydratase type I
MTTFNICAVIPIRNFKDLESNIKKAIESKSDFIEFRFDYIKDIKDIELDNLRRIRNLVPNNISFIFTFRDYRERGRIEVSLNQKASIITKLFRAAPDYIDLEMNSEDNLLSKASDLAIDTNVNLIFSNHDFKETKNLEKSINLIESFEKRLENLNFNKKILEYSVLKIIHTATKFSDNFIPLELCEYYRNKKKMIISFCMGNLGIFSRIFCLKAGAFLTYGSIEEITAPGQIKIEEIRKIIENFM